jgi:cytochrome P450
VPHAPTTLPRPATESADRPAGPPTDALYRLWDLPTDGAPPVQAVGDHVLVAGHAEVRAVLADPDTYGPDNALDAVTPIPVTALRVLTGHGFRLPPTLANNSTDSHPAIRAIVADALHPARVEEQRPWLTGVVRRRVAGLAARLRAGEPVDLYADLAADLPLRVLARMIELPAEEVGVVKEFSRAALELFWAPLDEGRQAHLAGIVGRYHEVLRASAASAGGMVGQLRAYARSRGGRADELVIGALFFLLVAGQETTSQFLTLLLHRLAAEPGAADRLVAGAVSVEDVVEEGLRLEPPIVSWRRVATRDAVLGGVRVRAGASVVLWLAAAGRDRTVVGSPEAFCPGQRGARRHLAFGAGAHRCLGAQLSRMEAAVVVGECAALLRGVRVIRAPHAPANLSFRMPDALVVAHA